MKELISEQQAEWIIRGLSLAVLFIGPWVAWVKTRSIRRAGFFAALGPILYLLWRVYNAIEDHYGLDSVKALCISAAVIMGTAVVLGLVYSYFIDRNRPTRASSRPKAARRRPA